MNLNIYDVPTERLEEEVIADLVKNALYAVRSDSSELVYECLGQAKMARALGAISRDTLAKIEHALINGYLNAGGADSARNMPGKSPPKTLDREEAGGISERAAGTDSTASDMAARGSDCGADQAYLLDMGTDREI